MRRSALVRVNGDGRLVGTHAAFGTLAVSRMPRMMFITSGSQACGGGLVRAASSSAGHGGAWGFARVVRLEQPSWCVLCTDLSTCASTGSLACLLISQLSDPALAELQLRSPTPVVILHACSILQPCPVPLSASRSLQSPLSLWRAALEALAFMSQDGSLPSVVSLSRWLLVAAWPRAATKGCKTCFRLWLLRIQTCSESRGVMSGRRRNGSAVDSRC